MTGPQVADNLALSAKGAGVPVLLSCPVERVDAVGRGYAVTGPGLAEPIRASHLVLATGVRARTLARVAGGPNGSEGKLTGTGEHIVAPDFRGKRVAVPGGGVGRGSGGKR